MSEAHRYMAFTRSEGGVIERTHKTAILGDVSEYATRERLLGWPEPYVFWRFSRDGTAFGIAPLSLAAEAALKNVQITDI